MFWILTLSRDSGDSPLDCKEIQPVNPKGNQSWIFTGRTDAEAETPILWSPDAKSWLIWKDPDAGKDWRWEEKRMTEDEMVGWQHWLDGHKFEQGPGVGDGQGSLAWFSPWGYKESDINCFTHSVFEGLKQTIISLDWSQIHALLRLFYGSISAKERCHHSLLLFLLSSHNSKHVFKSVIFEASYNWICFHLLVILNKLLKFHKQPLFF